MTFAAGTTVFYRQGGRYRWADITEVYLGIDGREHLRLVDQETDAESTCSVDWLTAHSEET